MREVSARVLTGAVCALALAAGASPTAAAASVEAPPSLSTGTTRPSIASTYGSGDFGRWLVDGFGLPAYRYTLDEATNPIAKQVELAGSTSAQHELGNDSIVAAAYNDGYTQLWSSARLFQWANLYQPSDRHYGGGFGYLNVNGKVASTMYLDRPAGKPFERDFGVGYYRRRLSFDGVRVLEDAFAPFGDDPVLLDDVTLRNTTRKPERVSWTEYWDVNPYDQGLGVSGNIGLAAPAWNAATKTLSVAQNTTAWGDTEPLSVFAAALNGPVADYETSVDKFFGSGSRGRPAEVVAGKLSDSFALPAAPHVSGSTLFAFRAPLTLAPHHAVTLRYVYGLAHPSQIAPLVTKYRATRTPFDASERAWADWLPQANFGKAYRWVARELDWDAYLLRAASLYEESCGYHTVTQGGDYQYALGANLGFRSWPHYLLGLVYSDPSLAREIIRYSVALQPPGVNQFPYGTGELCTRVDLGTSDDLDFWLLLAASEYGLGSRDLKFFNEQIPFYETHDEVSIWEHIKLAFAHQESLLGPHDEYLMGSTGDWSDFSTEFVGLTESDLVTAQCAYAYPRLAQLADLRGDHAFAAKLRAAGARDLKTLRAQWAGKGWYARGFSGIKQVGTGVIFEEPQPWAMLAGAPSRSQLSSLAANIHRYLDGHGSPHGPTKIGTAQSPAYDDPGVTERGPVDVSPPGQGGALVPNTAFSGGAEWPGGVWFDLNGDLTWAYAEEDGVLPNARALAWSEYLRNTLANHATQFPNHWDGTISVDDECEAWYSEIPAKCGNGLSTAYAGQITEQPTWMVMDAIRLAGVTPMQGGYLVEPHLPMRTFSLRMPELGVAAAAHLLRGYVVTQTSGSLRMQVAAPAGRGRLTVFEGRRRVAFTRSGRDVVFALPTAAGRAANWAVIAR
jgi:hypothetical protein